MEILMKAWIKKLDYFMLTKGGYALLIATVATVAYFAVLQWSNDYVKDVETLRIEMDESGYLSVNYDYEDKDNIYILWETDGGNIQTNHNGSIFAAENTSRGYYAYSFAQEQAVWSPEDADGSRYPVATVRAVLYEKREDNVYLMEDYVTELTITLKFENGKVIKTEDRLFSNPIRENDNTEWNQIYCIQQNQNGAYTYRYRTGAKIDKDEVLLLCWESGDAVLSEMDYQYGFIPGSRILEDSRNQSLLVTTTTIICEGCGAENKGKEIAAFLINEKTYHEYNNSKEVIAEDKKLYQASLLLP